MDEGLVRTLDGRFRRPLMSYFMRRTGDRAEAEDLTQQVFLRLIRVGGRLEIEHAPGYVFTIAANLLRDRARQSVVRARAEPDTTIVSEVVHEMMLEDISPERVLLGKESLADVLRTLDELGEKTRDIFILFRLENMRHREIADLLGLGVSSVEKHVMKAAHHLAARYRGEA